jgi:uncharacterized phage protein (TIGR02218 family)
LRTLNSQVLNHLNQRLTELTWCWKIERRDGVVQGFTRFNRNLVIDGIIYKARSGIKPTAIASDIALSVNNLSVDSVLSSDGITAADLSGGKYDYAKASIFLVCHSNLALRIPLITGTLGQTDRMDGAYSAEIRSLTQKLDQAQNQLTQKNCRYELGDANCTKELSDLTYSLSVLEVRSDREILLPSTFTERDRIFNFGKLTWTTGLNNGTVYAISTYDASSRRITLFEPTANPITAGDSFTAIAGCERTIRACKFYENDINFGAEPHVPGADEFLKGAK